MARMVMSSILPTGVGIIYNVPIYAANLHKNIGNGHEIVQKVVYEKGKNVKLCRDLKKTPFSLLGINRLRTFVPL